jgi:hypothetical protein
MEGVIMAEMGPVADIRNAAIMVAVIPVAVIAIVVGIGLMLLSSGLLLSLGMFTLCCLLMLRLRLVCCLLLALRLRLVLGLLARWPLRLLGVLWLSLMLGGLCLPLASALMLLVFLCECWNRGAEEHQ